MQCFRCQEPFRSGTCRAIKATPTRTVLFDRTILNRPLSTTPVREATHGAQGRANGPKNGAGRRLGAKKTGDEWVIPGNIIFRQRGTKWFPGDNVGMGRDHTIFALQPGFVKYYRNPSLHPKHRYIGIVFDKSQVLPAPKNGVTRRKLGMVAVSRKDVGLDVNVAADGSAQIGILPGQGNLWSRANTNDRLEGQSKLSKRALKEFKRRRATGRLPSEDMLMRSDYSYRESNWSIGRIAERAGVQVRDFDKKDRFKAWRLRTARRQRSAELRRMGQGPKSGKKDKPSRGGGGRKPQ